MRISVIANDGSPLGVTEKSIFGEDGRYGTGGAELAILTLCKGWHDAGHKVTLYNSPDIPDGSCFEQRGIDEYSPGNPCDILIVFRSPNSRMTESSKGKKIWFSCDQRTIGDFAVFAGKVDKIVTISPFHSQYFSDMYGIYNSTPIDLPVRTWEYNLEAKKIPYRCIFNSIPDRGALELAAVWARVVEQVPDASLVITSDWRLWSKHAPVELLNQYRTAFAGLRNVEYLGAVNRHELIKRQQEAQIHLNVNKYEELFCISLAENQVAGAFPISSTVGAMRTTNMGKKIEGTPTDIRWQDACVKATVELLQNQSRLKRLANKNQHAAIQRFSLDRILEEWNSRVFYG